MGAYCNSFWIVSIFEGIALPTKSSARKECSYGTNARNTSCGDKSRSNNPRICTRLLLARHKILLAKGILRIRLLIKKQSGSAMSTEIANLSRGYRVTVWKA